MGDVESIQDVLSVDREELERRIEEEGSPNANVADVRRTLGAGEQEGTLHAAERVVRERDSARAELAAVRYRELVSARAELEHERAARQAADAEVTRLRCASTGWQADAEGYRARIVESRARIVELEAILGAEREEIKNWRSDADDLERELASARRESARHEKDAQELLGDLVKVRELYAGLEGERDEFKSLLNRYGVSLAEERARRTEADRLVTQLRATVAGLSEELVRVRAEGRRS